MAPAVFPLAAGTQSYEWGRIGSSSKVAQYAAKGCVPDFSIDESKPYAELWMGTHTSLPSRLLDSNETLAGHLVAHQEFIGASVSARFSNAQAGQLPFLFKILSIRKALSIQAHPDKELAEKLHAERPDLYKDPNHKPEMAIALTPFTALCGFRPLPQISVYLVHIPELAALIPTSIVSALQSATSLPATDALAKRTLRDLFTVVMTAPPDQVKKQVRLLVGRYKSGGYTVEESDVHALVVELDSQFPDDVGVFCVFLLNVLHLQPGEAIFLGAGEPHAYIAGDIVETMATSDNVLRAGLTPKMRDVSNLVASLTYRAAESTVHAVLPMPFSRSSSNTLLYDPPIAEFSVCRTSLPRGESSTHEGLNGPSIIILTQGTGRIDFADNSIPTKEGSVYFIGAGTRIRFDAEEELVLYRAFVEA